MPELPEVETIRLGLQSYLVGHIIERVEVRLQKMVTGDTRNITGVSVTSVRRFGKGLVIDCANGYSIAIHVKMTGQLIYQDQKMHPQVSKVKVGTVPNAFTHVIFHLDHHGKLYYNDMRQFGWIKIINTADLKTLRFFKQLGTEPFRDLTEEAFEKILQSGNNPIKVLIMNQAKISGIGNIYANDALFFARISPWRKANSLSRGEMRRLYKAVLHVLKIGLDSGGASEFHYVNVLGQEGAYQRHFLVYAKQGKLCPNKCEETLKKIKLGGRGTYFCPVCQR